jgi:hypothetical protein
VKHSDRILYRADLLVVEELEDLGSDSNQEALVLYDRVFQ